MKRLLVCGLTVAGLFLGPARADAALFTLTAGGSSDTVFFNPLAGCTTCSGTAEFTLTDSDTLTVKLTNTSTDGVSGLNLITALGFDTTPDITVTSFSAPSGWTVDNSNAVLQMEVLNSTTNGTNNALDGGQSITFVINFSGATQTLTLDDSAIHIQALVGGASIKITGDGDGGGSNEGEGGTSSPEPATLLLFGTALTAAATRMRRNRK
jgi:hypothetical protein